MSGLTDAITVTGATTGKVITEYGVTLGSITNAQKTALANLVTSLGKWPGGAGNVYQVTFYRTPGQPNVIAVGVQGYIVHADGNAALTAKAEDDRHEILGRV